MKVYSYYVKQKWLTVCKWVEVNMVCVKRAIHLESSQSARELALFNYLVFQVGTFTPVSMQ